MVNTTIAIVRSRSVCRELYRFLGMPAHISPAGAIRGTSLHGPRNARRMIMEHFDSALQQIDKRKLLSLCASGKGIRMKPDSVFTPEVRISWTRTEGDSGVFTIEGGPWEVREVALPEEEAMSGRGLRSWDDDGNCYLIWPAYEAPVPLGRSVKEEVNWESAAPAWF